MYNVVKDLHQTRFARTIVKANRILFPVHQLRVHAATDVTPFQMCRSPRRTKDHLEEKEGTKYGLELGRNSVSSSVRLLSMLIM